MLRFVPDHLKTKKMCKSVVKELLFIISYVYDRDKVTLENGGMLMFVPDYCKNKK